MDSRRHFQQEIIALEVYRERIDHGLYYGGDALSDWIQAGKILDQFEIPFPDGRYKEYERFRKFIVPSYQSYLDEIKEKYGKEEE